MGRFGGAAASPSASFAGAGAPGGLPVPRAPLLPCLLPALSQAPLFEASCVPLPLPPPSRGALTSPDPPSPGAQTLEMLEKREAHLQKKMGDELKKAKEFTRQKNKRAALQCLKRRKMYEAQADTLANQQLRLYDQKLLLEGAKATAETVGAMKSTAAALKVMQKETKVEDIDKTMDEINEQTENMRQIQEALGQPMGAAAEIDEDELDLELEELEAEDLDEMLMEPAAEQAEPALELPSVPQRTEAQTEDEELEALQAEMAL